jgi:hypothetical protein
MDNEISIEEEIYRDVEHAERVISNIQESQRDSLIKLLVEAASMGIGDQAALTSRDICDETGWGVDKVRNTIRTLKAEGLIENTRKEMEQIDGVIRLVPAYKLKEGVTIGGYDNHNHDKE